MYDNAHSPVFIEMAVKIDQILLKNKTLVLNCIPVITSKVSGSDIVYEKRGRRSESILRKSTVSSGWILQEEPILFMCECV